MKPNNFLTLVIGGGYFERLRSIRRFAAPVFRSFSELSVSIKKIPYIQRMLYPIKLHSIRMVF